MPNKPDLKFLDLFLTYSVCILLWKRNLYTPVNQVLQGYIGNTFSVRPFMILVSVSPFIWILCLFVGDSGILCYLTHSSSFLLVRPFSILCLKKRLSYIFYLQGWPYISRRLVCRQTYPGPGVYLYTGLGCELTCPYCYHQGYTDIQSRER